ncbi:benzoyl-CoA reductase subunit C [Ruminiclostridium hungatei]|uniref:Benzoyl-CoA reductase subunit C n=1 Tax=Ruminiclostridium hungatei TaxID=48256 RepID=A0A1V4SME3_RUMHU|nr:2-hydroxyacyl-CoA dehydratase family protein [Ruminiclostridium hungatei]OPX44963.1 benzoyl-CoA reductase subunit C [Ruminiclostridium hungatei]
MAVQELELTNKKKSTKFSTVKFDENIKEKIEAAPDLVFRDGSRVSGSEMWRFMTTEGPKRYPNLFSKGKNHGFSDDAELISGFRRNYFNTTMYDRLNRFAAKGTPVVFIQGGQTHEPYYAAGGIPIRPGQVNGWATNSKENMDYDEADLRRLQIREIGRQALTVDACQTAKYEIIQNELVQGISIIAPYLCTRCSDIGYGVEAHRHGKVQLPLLPVDFPVNNQQNKPWAREYVAENLRRLVRKIAELSKVEVNDDVLWKEIKLHNEKRRLAREYLDLWWSAPVPPTNSQDHTAIAGLGNESSNDPVAAKQILEESLKEVKERIRNNVKGKNLSDDPVRLFICGSCVNPNPHVVDRAGGVVVGKDDGLSEIFYDVEETGDPYEQLAKTMLSFPYELPTEERGRWVAEQVKKSRADGMIFMYQWGCNFQSAAARLVADVVKKEAGVPTIIIERAMAESAQGQEQLHNRVEVFIEMLRQGKK